MIVARRKTSPANRGKDLELVVTASTGDILVLDHHGQQAKRLPGGRMVAKRGPVDFTGTVNGTGRSIRFDAKKCAAVRAFNVGDETHFPEHQRQGLIRHGEAGAIAGLLVESAVRYAYFWLDWTHLKKREASIKWNDARWVNLGPASHRIRFADIPGVIVSGTDRAGEGR